MTARMVTASLSTLVGATTPPDVKHSRTLLTSHGSSLTRLEPVGSNPHASLDWAPNATDELEEESRVDAEAKERGRAAGVSVMDCARTRGSGKETSSFSSASSGVFKMALTGRRWYMARVGCAFGRRQGGVASTARVVQGGALSFVVLFLFQHIHRSQRW